MHYGYGSLIGFIIFILDIVAIIDVLKSSRGMGAKILWTLLILLFPLVGLIIYYLVGRK